MLDKLAKFVKKMLRVPVVHLPCCLCPAAKASWGNSQKKVCTISMHGAFCHLVASSHPAATTLEPEGSSETNGTKADSNSTSSESGGEGNSTITDGIGGAGAEAVGCNSVNIFFCPRIFPKSCMFEVLRDALTT